MKKLRKLAQKITVAHIATYLTIFGVLIGGVTFYSFLNLKNLVVQNLSENTLIQAGVIESLNIYGLQFLFSFFAVILFIPISLFMTANHFKSQIIPLNQQLDAMLEGNYETQRRMRKTDEFLPVIEKMHQLNNKVKETLH
ncbi:MAG: hypothetical protein KDD58_00555 [Bdellovibrionales bacterium]|nr:hypothetical protein [Bdellovibrionales bacterium]